MKKDMKFRSTGMALLAALTMVIAGSASAADHAVSDWAGVLAATPVSGDTVTLAAGTYVSSPTLNMLEGVTYRGVGLTTIIEPVSGNLPFQARATVIPAVDVDQGTWTLESMLIRNGDNRALRCFVTDTGTSVSGELFSPQTINITDVDFTNVSDGGVGGAIQFRRGTVTLTDCNFTDVSSDGNGGAIFGGTQGDATLNVTRCTFTNCQTTDVVNGNRDGGAIYTQSNTTLNVTDCVFTDCVSVDDGGAIAQFQDFHTATLTGSTFTNCDSGDDGGGYFSANNDCNVTVDDCTFTDCDADDGGGFYIQSSRHITSITNSSFTNCSSVDDGGAARWGGNDHVATIDNCVFDGNEAGRGTTDTNFDGGHLYFQSRSEATITNSIFLNGIGEDSGGIHVDGGNQGLFHMSNCLLANNVSSDDAPYRFRGSDIQIVNNTFVGDTAGDDGEGIIRLSPDNTPTVFVFSNNIVMNGVNVDTNVPHLAVVKIDNRDAALDAISTITNNNFFNNSPHTNLVLGSILDGETVDPLSETGRVVGDNFLDGSFKPTADSYRIVDLGDPATATAADLEGTAAVGLRDIGAYEFTGVLNTIPTPTPIPTLTPTPIISGARDWRQYSMLQRDTLEAFMAMLHWNRPAAKEISSAR